MFAKSLGLSPFAFLRVKSASHTSFPKIKSQENLSQRNIGEILSVFPRYDGKQ